MDRKTPELSARSRRMSHGLDDIELPEDVISVVVDFLNWKLEDGNNDFSFLANAAKISRGFRYHVKRKKAEIIENDRRNKELKEACLLWCDPETREYAEAKYGHISEFDTSKVTDMTSLFAGQKQFNENLSKWQTKKVETIERMFDGCSSFQGVGLTNWNTHACKSMSRMFQCCPLFNPNLTLWNVSNVKNMERMFQNASSFNRDLSWDVSKLNNIRSMFKGAVSFDGDISAFDTSSVTNMNAVFENASSFNGGIENWNVKKVKRMYCMFKKATSFNGDISSWDVSKVEDMGRMFWGASAFDRATIKQWNLSGVIFGYNLP
ncbi:hypothetical protein TrLO_g4330 [Triparma laevis f. longispina]|uniref:BspA family leucine-rich repeat surface protein n=1 Tax=Triparma laevis f. longispina TaxID=1714387 RepID=A0A9W7KXF9_9STRA|nr:hypothetical protein TrLO_g4330 [Triparma laevis f. longispina]